MTTSFHAIRAAIRGGHCQTKIRAARLHLGRGHTTGPVRFRLAAVPSGTSGAADLPAWVATAGPRRISVTIKGEWFGFGSEQ